MNNPQIVPALIGALILWRVYSRVRRNLGRQKFSESRTWTSIVIITLLLALIGYGALRGSWSIWGLGAGLAGGLLLAVISHRFTQFEHADEGMFYTPHPYIGIAVSLLLIGRLAYRFFATGLMFDHASSQIGQSPLTLALFGFTFGYYLSSAFVLMYEFRRAKRA